MTANIEDIVNLANGETKEGKPGNLLIKGMVTIYHKPTVQNVTVTAVGRSGERAGLVMTAELKKWLPVGEFELILPEA